MEIINETHSLLVQGLTLVPSGDLGSVRYRGIWGTIFKEAPTLTSLQVYNPLLRVMFP